MTNVKFSVIIKLNELLNMMVTCTIIVLNIDIYVNIIFKILIMHG